MEIHLKRILLVLALMFGLVAIARGEAGGDEACIAMIESAKRAPNFSMEFWSHHHNGQSACYRRIKDEKSGLKKRLEKLGYEVDLVNYKFLQCHDYCDVAKVNWLNMKNLGLSAKERKSIAMAWRKNEEENAAACARVMMWEPSPSPEKAEQCRSRSKKEISFFVPCLEKTGNLYRCHNEFHRIKK